MADKKRCVVTGLGLICGVGDNVKDSWDAVTLGHSGIDEVKSVDTSKCYAHKGAEVFYEHFLNLICNSIVHFNYLT